MCTIIERVQRYLEEKGTTDEICRIYLRRILHTYYKFDYKAHQRQLTPPEGSSKVSAWPPCQRGEGCVHWFCMSFRTSWQILYSLGTVCGGAEGLGRGWMASRLWLLKAEPFTTIVLDIFPPPTISPPTPYPSSRSKTRLKMRARTQLC